MDPILDYVRSREEELIALIRRLVECESPSGDRPALSRVADLIAAEAAPLASLRRLRGGHLLGRVRLPGGKKTGRILVLGHFDTVWPAGTLARMPFAERGGRLWGPGVFDMKAGIAFFLFAMRALRDLAVPLRRNVFLLLTADEETGSVSSRSAIEREARLSDAVLVLEPGAGLEGRLKTARKGIGAYTVTVEGVAAHAGVDFAAGASAILELARQTARLAALTRIDRGITVNPGVIAGGSRSNVVAASARLELDVRIARLRDFPALDRRIRGIEPFDKRCRVAVAGGLNRPPMERSPGVARLFAKARQLAAELGVCLEESSTGGGSDGNFTAALGIPTLDGLGGVGEGAHAPNESVLRNRIADRTALLAKLVAAL